MNAEISRPADVSRETLDKLTAFHDLLLKWTPKINLISRLSVSEIWDRHIWDSSQAWPLVQNWKLWLDIGSGGGFPAIVISIIAHEKNPEGQVRMIESDHRKAVFLRTVVRELGLNASVEVSRVEAARAAQADVISARALADLSGLLAHAERHLAPGGTAIFFKGETWEKELRGAQETWSFSVRSHKSKTNPAAAVLEIKEIKRV